MPSITKRVYYNDKLGNVQPFIPENIQYECRMGSQAYGVANDESDVDIYGISIPPKEYTFPHTGGYLVGFDKDRPKFNQFQKHHVKGDDDKEYDFAIYDIVKFFKLAMDNNPNIIDSLFVPQTCVSHYTKVGRIMRENRHKFLHKGSYHRYKGYAYSQIKKLENPGQGDRSDLVEKHGYDTKFAYHCVRLLSQAEQILVERDLDLRQHKDTLKSIRQGEWSQDRVEEWFDEKEKQLDELYQTSDIPHEPNSQEIKSVLMDCLEEFYGDLTDDFVSPDRYKQAIQEVKKIINKF